MALEVPSGRVINYRVLITLHLADTFHRIVDRTALPSSHDASCAQCGFHVLRSVAALCGDLQTGVGPCDHHQAEA